MSFFRKYHAFGTLFIRLAFGFQLMQGTQDNVFSYARMLEFSEFLAARRVPFPLAGAFVSAYAQFICGMLFIIGWQTRYAAAVMVINFIAALLIAHVGLPYEQNILPINLLAVSLFLLFNGAGALSVDTRREGSV